jgi:hypothetical protein
MLVTRRQSHGTYRAYSPAAIQQFRKLPRSAHASAATPRSVTSKSLGRTPQLTAVPPSIVHLHGPLLLRCTRIVLPLPCRTRSLVGTSPSGGTSTIRGQAGPGRHAPRQRVGGELGCVSPSQRHGDAPARQATSRHACGCRGPRGARRPAPPVSKSNTLGALGPWADRTG